MKIRIMGLACLVGLLVAQPVAMAQVRLQDVVGNRKPHIQVIEGLPTQQPEKAPEKKKEAKPAAQAKPAEPVVTNQKPQVVKAAPSTYPIPDNLRGVYTSKDRYMGYPFFGGNNYLQSQYVKVHTDYDLGATVQGVSGQTTKVNGQDFMVKDGYFFKPVGKGKYQVVKPPLNAKTAKLPGGAVKVGSKYYFNGSYYQQSGNQYQVVQPTPGAIVPYLSNESKASGSGRFSDGSNVYEPFFIQGNLGNTVQFKVVH